MRLDKNNNIHIVRRAKKDGDIFFSVVKAGAVRKQGDIYVNNEVADFSDSSFEGQIWEPSRPDEILLRLDNPLAKSMVRLEHLIPWV